MARGWATGSRSRAPESHAASFALTAWANGWLKVHHPAAFLAGLLNAWPMGFYYPAMLVNDAQQHGTDVLPADVTRSGRLRSVEWLRGPWPDIGEEGGDLDFLRRAESEGRQPITSVLHEDQR